jgi:hypothetical protein
MLPSGFLTKILYAFLIASVRVTRLTYVIILHFITLRNEEIMDFLIRFSPASYYTLNQHIIP